jgi:hypothetical protein
MRFVAARTCESFAKEAFSNREACSGRVHASVNYPHHLFMEQKTSRRRDPVVRQPIEAYSSTDEKRAWWNC